MRYGVDRRSLVLLLALGWGSPAMAGEIRVYVAGDDGQVVGVADAEATLVLTFPGGTSEEVRLRPQAGSARGRLEHGGQIKPLGRDRTCELVIAGEAPAGGEACLSGTVNLDRERFGCPMACVPIQPNRGTCSKCGMALVPMGDEPIEFSAELRIRLDRRSLRAEGFLYPQPPQTVAAALSALRACDSAVRAAVRGTDYDGVRSQVRLLTRIATALPDLPGDLDRPARSQLRSQGQAIQRVAGELETAASDRSSGDAQKALDPLGPVMAALEGLVASAAVSEPARTLVYYFLPG